MNSKHQKFRLEDDYKLAIDLWTRDWTGTPCNICNRKPRTVISILPVDVYKTILHYCLLFELSQDPNTIFICNDCNIVVNRCIKYMNGMIIHIFRFSSGIGNPCVICRGFLILKPLNIPENSSKHIVLSRMKGKFFLQKNLGICIGCDYLLTDLHQLQECLFNTILAKDEISNEVQIGERHGLDYKKSAPVDIVPSSSNIYKSCVKVDPEQSDSVFAQYNTDENASNFVDFRIFGLDIEKLTDSATVPSLENKSLMNNTKTMDFVQEEQLYDVPLSPRSGKEQSQNNETTEKSIAVTVATEVVHEFISKAVAAVEAEKTKNSYTALECILSYYPNGLTTQAGASSEVKLDVPVVSTRATIKETKSEQDVKQNAGKEYSNCSYWDSEKTNGRARRISKPIIYNDPQQSEFLNMLTGEKKNVTKFLEKPMPTSDYLILNASGELPENLETKRLSVLEKFKTTNVQAYREEQPRGSCDLQKDRPEA